MASLDGETIQGGHYRIEKKVLNRDTIHGMPCFDCCHRSNLGSHDTLRSLIQGEALIKG